MAHVVLPNQIYAELSLAGLSLRVVGYQAWHQGRNRVERFIAECFEQVHGAHVSHFLPSLITLESASGELYAAVGVRSARSEKLFLEQYLGRPIEVEIQRLSRQKCCRNDVIEVGNLATLRPGMSRIFFAVLTDVLMAWGARWVSCTGTTEVVNVFHRLQMNPLQLGDANVQQLQDKSDSWGSYYQHNPVVMAGELKRGYQLVQANGLLDRCDYQRLENDDVFIA